MDYYLHFAICFPFSVVIFLSFHQFNTTNSHIIGRRKKPLM